MFRSTLALIAATAVAAPASAQSLGTFKWQLQPYCNVVTLSVTQQDSVYTLDGFDDQCGAATKAPVTGSAVPNADGTIQFGLNIVSSPGGVPSQVSVPLRVATFGGTWTDSIGNSGTFSFGTATGGKARPVRAAVPVAIDLKTDGGIVSRGKAVTDGQPTSSLPVNSKSTRMLWDPVKGAFRAGGDKFGEDDDTIGLYSVGMGVGAQATGVASVALSGHARGDSAVAMGFNAQADADYSLALGFASYALGKRSVALGASTAALADNSVAIGSLASASHTGSIVIGDSALPLNSTANYQVTIGARGGARVVTSMFGGGVQIAPNASAWSTLSDVNSKENFRDLDGGDVLAKLASMSIREWNYKAQDAAIRHVGPTAQDFHAAFGLGEDPLRISTIDADGIALAGVSALARENAALRAELDAVKADLAAIRDLVAAGPKR